ncbi:hypothetical protein GCM10010466_67980 [Planomonospora alba]|uniref:Uncharacterized protein n=1 Tax=Planomonospora alba TaxID=161354 RepID=A0ABP6P5D4_9ACTN
MQVTSLPTLLLALVLAGPALWHAFVLRDLDVVTALTRYLLAVLVSAAMLGALRRITASYGPDGAEADGERADAMSVSVDRVNGPRRRATDRPPAPGAPAVTGELPATAPAALPAAPGEGRG